MSKTAWVMVLLLIGSNAAWLLMSNQDEDGNGAPTPPTVDPKPVDAAPDPPPTDPGPVDPKPEPEPKPDPKPEPPKPKGQSEAQKAWAGAREWFEAVRQSGDAERRRKAVDEMRAALESDDSLQQRTAITALARIGMTRTKFDGTSLRKPLLAVLEKAKDPDVIQKTLQSLHSADPQPGDLDRVTSMLEKTTDAKLRSRLAPLVATVANHKLTGKAADAVLELLSDRSPLVLKPTINSFEDAQVSPAVEARLIELSGTPDYGLYTLRFALARLDKKSEKVVVVLLAAVRGPDTKLHRWAVRGLRSGVPRASHPEIVAASLELFRKSRDAAVQTDCLRTIRETGDETVVPELKKIVADKKVGQAHRDEAAKVILQLAPPAKKDG